MAAAATCSAQSDLKANGLVDSLTSPFARAIMAHVRALAVGTTCRLSVQVARVTGLGVVADTLQAAISRNRRL